MVEIRVSGFRLENKSVWGRGEVEAGCLKVEGRDTGGDAEIS